MFLLIDVIPPSISLRIVEISVPFAWYVKPTAPAYMIVKKKNIKSVAVAICHWIRALMNDVGSNYCADITLEPVESRRGVADIVNFSVRRPLCYPITCTINRMIVDAI